MSFESAQRHYDNEEPDDTDYDEVCPDCGCFKCKCKEIEDYEGEEK